MFQLIVLILEIDAWEANESSWAITLAMGVLEALVLLELEGTHKAQVGRVELL